MYGYEAMKYYKIVDSWLQIVTYIYRRTRRYTLWLLYIK